MFARSRVRSVRKHRLAAAALLAALAGSLAAPCPEAAAEDDAVAVLEDDVEKFRREMETAFLDVQKDAERARGAEWARTPFGDDFSTALTEFVREARARTEARTAQQDLDDAAAVMKRLAARGVEPPLTRTSALVVLGETARAARGDRDASARESFVTATRTVFSAAKAEDVWDASFVDLPVVQSFRTAKAKLAAAQAVSAPPKEEAKPAEPEAPAPEKVADELVAFERSRPWTGPWTGWTSDLTEKQNKRQQRSLKAFWIDRHEVTCEQYLAFVESLAPAARKAMAPQGWTLGEDDLPRVPDGKGRHPVTGVTLRQATAYAESVGKRLPTCDEWERVAAGADKDARTFPWGVTDEGRSWSHLGVEPKATVPVDAFPADATPEGVIGMAGNVAELVATYPDRTEVGKSGPEKEKQVLVCGGSFTSRTSECATSWRWVLDADGASPSVGFRCVMDEAEYRKRKK